MNNLETLKLALEAFEADASNENFLVLKHCVREALSEQPTVKQSLTVQPSKPWVNATEWRGLTDEELKPLCDENHIIFGAYTVDFIQAIEAKLKEKNA